jgi:arsenite methyltransferase
MRKPEGGTRAGVFRQLNRPLLLAKGFTMSSANVKGVVREKYGEAALRLQSGATGDCCGVAGSEACDPIASNIYSAAQERELPDRAIKASLGCGNPAALADLNPGETVLDLGSGSGIDVLLSARRIGPTGKAYGLEMTDEMLALAEENKRKSGLTNVEFLKGEIENIPLPSDSVDVIISNCVINLSGDKDRALKEAFRMLKPAGRFAMFDVAVKGHVPAEIKKSLELWVGCVAGVLSDYDYVAKLAKAGFDDIDIEPTRIYSIEDARTFLASQGFDIAELAKEAEGKFVSAFIRAKKPAAMPCCAPSCCS